MSLTLTSQRQKTPEHIVKYVIVMLRTVKQESYQLNEDEYIRVSEYLLRSLRAISVFNL